MNFLKKHLGNMYISLIFLFFYLPIIVLMFFSFNSSRSLSVFNGFSLQWYERLIEDREMIKAIYNTVVIAIFSTGISTIIGTITAIGLTGSKRILKQYLLNVNDLPMLNPDIVTAIAMMLFFSVIQMEKGFMTMLLAHIMFSIPYVVINVYPKVKALDPNLIDAAMDLGATPYQALFKVLLPQIKNGITSGMLIAFTMSIDDFVISYFVTGKGVQNISIVVYTMAKRINPMINALSTIMIIIITVMLIFINFVPSKANKK